jgi:tetratricopeptide (TPR) repeat protein
VSPLGEEGRLSAVRPRNPQAARLYAAGLAALHRFDALGARDQLSQAVAADPTFPLAHAALADALRELGSAPGARDESARAFQLAGNLPRAERLARATGRWPRAIDTYRTLATLFPDDLSRPPRRGADQRARRRSARSTAATADAARRGSAGSAGGGRGGRRSSDYERALAAPAGPSSPLPRGASLLARALLAQWWSPHPRPGRRSGATGVGSAPVARGGGRPRRCRRPQCPGDPVTDQGSFAEAIQADLQALGSSASSATAGMSWSSTISAATCAARRLSERAACEDPRPLPDSATDGWRGRGQPGRMLFKPAVRRRRDSTTCRLRRIGEERGRPAPWSTWRW